MKNKKLKWLIYTLMVGLIPIIIRIFISSVFYDDSINIISISDLVAFGLILHISTINELEHLADDKDWKTVQNGIALFLIVIYATFFCLSIIIESSAHVLNIEKIKYCTIVLVFASILICLSVYDRLSKHENFGQI